MIGPQKECRFGAFAEIFQGVPPKVRQNAAGIPPISDNPIASGENPPKLGEPVFAARLLTPFASRNYRLFFSGQIISLIGSWMTNTATVWLVYDLTGSPLWLGLVALTGQLPAILLSPFAGVWVDRLPRLKLLICTQIAAMLQALTLAAFTLSGHITIGILVVLSVVQGVITAIDLPTRQSLPVLLVEKREHLAGLIGMNASMFNLARLVGPAIGGLVIAAWGTGYCFLIDGLSYVAVLTALGFMRLNAAPPPPRMASVWEEMKLGFRYAFSSLPLTTHILFPCLMGIFGLSYGVLIPVYANHVFHGDARTLGWLMSSSAAGAVLAALYLASRKELRGIGRVILFGTVSAGCALFVFAFSQQQWLSMLCLLFTGLGSILVMAANNTLIQNMVEEDKRGRVMSIYTMGFSGGMPLGALLTGTLADWTSITFATCVNGAACILMGLIFAKMLPALRREARPLLERSGALAPPETVR